MYIVNEYQTSNGTTAIVTPATHADRNSALSTFFSRCSSAVISGSSGRTVMSSESSASGMTRRRRNEPE